MSVCIVTYNEALCIKDTLNTIKFADEIIIVDSYSTDQTVDICKKYTDKIYFNTWIGCGFQKDFALKQATCEWVLILDADERLSLELQQEIKLIIKLSDSVKSDNDRSYKDSIKFNNNNNKIHDYSGFKIPFKTFYLGKFLQYGNCLHETHLRLFKREYARIIPNYVHFGLEVTGTIGVLKNYIYHCSFPNVEKMLTKINNYSTLGAKDQQIAGKHAGIFTAIFHGLVAFCKSYILKLGFLDGKYGFMFAVYNAEGSYYKYIKLMQLNC